ncbi:MAG: universal stress protein [Hyphomicrobiaceae bacterium]
MSYKTILAYLNASRRTPEVTRAAAAVARQFGSHIIGLSIVPRVPPPPATYADAAGQIVAMQKRALDEEGQRVEDAFRRTLEGSDLKSEWRQVKEPRGLIETIVCEHARAADLVVVGQPDNSDDIYPPGDVGEVVMMECGRPVLVVPRKGSFEEIGRAIALAYDGSREAARAAFDALPLLAGAREVHVVTFDTLKGRNQDRVIPGAEIATTLTRHGVNCKVANPMAVRSGIADDLMAYAGAQSLDLVVMGGYGHARWSEIVFGGATRDMFSVMSVPVLMSH